jgi:hypothetical protein
VARITLCISVFCACRVVSCSSAGNIIIRPSQGGAAGLRAPTSKKFEVVQLLGRPVAGAEAP